MVKRWKNVVKMNLTFKQCSQSIILNCYFDSNNNASELYDETLPKYKTCRTGSTIEVLAELRRDAPGI